MATKRFNWTGETELHIEILDGPAAGEYTVDIEEHGAGGGLLTIGYLGAQAVAVRTSDIPDWDSHEQRTIRWQRGQRQWLANHIRACAIGRSDVIYRHSNSPDAGQRFAAADAKLDAAHRALREFDAAHPELIAALEAEQHASAERGAWR